MIHLTYFAVLFFTVIICFLASFHRLIRFDKFFGIFLVSAIIVAVPFIIWDIWFTSIGVWWFDTSYTVGLKVAGLPIEEWLFFICIPFSCVFTYYCFERFFNLDFLKGLNNLIAFVTIIVCTLFALLHDDKLYTLMTAIVTSVTMIFLHFISRIDWIGKASFLYTILMLGFFPVNGILTGSVIASPIVNYNPDEFLGIRMITIPIEDAVYGYAQFLWVLYFFQLLSKNKIQKHIKASANKL